jgi:hypothetical protein
MIRNDIKNNAPLIKIVINLGFVIAENNPIDLTLYSREKGNHYEIYFTIIDDIEDVFIKKFIPNFNDVESKWLLEGRYMGYKKVIDLLNIDFKFELRKQKLKKLLNE